MVWRHESHLETQIFFFQNWDSKGGFQSGGRTSIAKKMLTAIKEQLQKQRQALQVKEIYKKIQ